MLTRSKRARDGTLVEHQSVSVTQDRTSNTPHAKPTLDAVDAESVRFMKPFLSNEVFLQTLSAQEILKIKNVSKTWAQWTAQYNNNDIIGARTSNDCRDWYFPVFGAVDVGAMAGSSHGVPMLHGMWHETGDGSSASKLRKLPDLLYLSPPCIPCICNSEERIEYVVRASLGGLLLLETVMKFTNPACSMGYIRWPALMVTNPLTKQFQVLPICDGEQVEDRWCYESPKFLMMVDENMNNYKVLVYVKLLDGEYSNLYVYDSESTKWEVVHGFDRLIQPRLGMWADPIPRMAISYPRDIFLQYHASAWWRGCLYLADIRMPTDMESNMDHLITAVVRLFEVDIKTGQWILRTELPICKSFNTGVQIQYIKVAVEYDTRCVHRNLELVECMGHLYAIIPARLDEFLHQPNKYRENIWEDVHKISSKYMPLQFYIFQLTGEVGEEGHGVLRIETPLRKNCTHLARRQRLFKMLTMNRDQLYHFRNWFSCMAKGSIIWVSIEDYLLQYDVVSGECKTEFAPKHIQHQEKAGVAYRASFHMKA